MRYTIYRVTNVENGKFYIGKHQTNNPGDRYFGSGRAIKHAISLHGKNNFVKEVLFDFDTEEEMNRKERELVTEELVQDPLCYNLSVGGEGGPHFRGRTHSDATKSRISEIRTGYRPTPEVVAKFVGRKHSEETKRKIADAAKGRVWSQDVRDKISASLKAHNAKEP